MMATSTMSEVCHDIKKERIPSSWTLDVYLTQWQSKTPNTGRVSKPHGRGTRNDSPEGEHGIRVQGPESGYMRQGGTSLRSDGHEPVTVI